MDLTAREPTSRTSSSSSFRACIGHHDAPALKPAGRQTAKEFHEGNYAAADSENGVGNRWVQCVREQRFQKPFQG
ncbi:unnamed protein product [Clonostachys rosea f. rosea IK726]|uniref:Uncharacterized protein n=1 Tax=Clonostachys rosea f. rosea IK726 TaxID=1349383 RepID=A0ACA9TAF3_BIOOC|nr:unnamed protein product [Clonostachys rosea f. rosea IK726]